MSSSCSMSVRNKGKQRSSYRTVWTLEVCTPVWFPLAPHTFSCLASLTALMPALKKHHPLAFPSADPVGFIPQPQCVSLSQQTLLNRPTEPPSLLHTHDALWLLVVLLCTQIWCIQREGMKAFDRILAENVLAYVNDAATVVASLFPCMSTAATNCGAAG